MVDDLWEAFMKEVVKSGVFEAAEISFPRLWRKGSRMAGDEVYSMRV